MAYSELIKNFNRVRDYMREFYVYGFKSRGEYTKKSARSYDDERRRLESWLGDYMKFSSSADGKRVFLSIDSRISQHNPLYKAWKAKSFTDGDITLHFILMDILYDPSVSMSLNDIMEGIDAYLFGFNDPRMFDASTVRKKLNEYIAEGIVVGKKQGKTMYYRRADDAGGVDADILDFFSETAPCGVIGSYVLDREEAHSGYLAYKHHYITGAMDSEIVCQLLDAMHEKRIVTLEMAIRRNVKASDDKDESPETLVVPLKIMNSVQGGRQYLMAYDLQSDRIKSFRIDNIITVNAGNICNNFDELRRDLSWMLPHMWGVSTRNPRRSRLVHVEFTVRYGADEEHIHKRLEREKRCGSVERIGEDVSRFSADVYDASELIPWIRTFICRITDISFADKSLEKRFKDDMKEMYAMYGIEGGDGG
jgi:hypothetical protein